jgi:bifunctional non-homologous end joining protein LigD
MTVQLNEYNQKRNFETTPEPHGLPENSDARLRFVVQHHIARRDHYDFRLEWNGTLLSWAVPKGPSYNTADKRLAIQVEDHPIEYRNFEGTIPKGEYGGGVVMLWDEGYWEPDGNVDESLHNGALKFALKGRRLKGKWALIRLKAKDNEANNNWLLLKEKDKYSESESEISEFATSIRTGCTMEEIDSGKNEKIIKNPFDRADAQLAKLVNKFPDGKGWLYELKYDGYRIIAFIENNMVRLMTRNGNDYTKRFSNIETSLIDLAAGRAMVLDGEMIISGKTGKTDFQALQNYMKNPNRQDDLAYVIFDLLALDGEDMRERRLIDRKETLEALMKDINGNLYYSRHIKEKGEESFIAACKMGMEGIIGKKHDSIYSGMRNGDWIKLKCEKRQEFVIGGYTLSGKKANGISSLLLGVYEGEELIYTGRAGTGLSENDRKELETKFKSLIKARASFKQAPKPRANEKITWIEPELAAEIRFAEWTKDNLLRHASYKGLRTDKNPKDIKKEVVDEKKKKAMKTNEKSVFIKGIKITNPDKVIFDDSEITKEDVVRYYEKVSQRMMPYVGHRILSIVRCPKGISQTCFYKKHPGPKSKGIVTMSVLTGSGEAEEYFYIENAEGIISEAQMGTLEFHTWGSRADEIEKPDIMVFDLDPDEKMDLSRIRTGVKDLKSILDELSLRSYLKTSGGKGYHVLIPLKPSVSWDVFHDFSRNIAKVMEQKWPDRYTSNVRKAERRGKIFIDWIRNGKGATSIAPYSLRARKGAKVSMPILWAELDTVAPDGVDITDAIARISGIDPWEDFFKNNQLLK